MQARRFDRSAFVPLMLIGVAILAFPAFEVLREGLAAGTGEAWMVLWLLAFVLILPAVLLLLPWLARLIELARRRDNIPLMGGNGP